MGSRMGDSSLPTEESRSNYGGVITAIKILNQHHSYIELEEGLFCKLDLCVM